MPENNIRILRSENYLSKAQVSKNAHIGTGRLRNIENGAEPTTEEIVNLVQLFDADPIDLFPSLHSKECQKVKKIIQKNKILDELQQQQEHNSLLKKEAENERKRKQNEAYEAEKKKRRESKKRIKQLEELLQAENNGSVLREIVFPEGYQDAGITILQGFVGLVRNKYKDQDVSISIEQSGLKVIMRVHAEHGVVEEVEEYLDQYSLVVIGERSIDSLTDDPKGLYELQSQLNIARAQLENAREMNLFLKTNHETRIASLEEQNQWLRESLSLAIASEREQIHNALQILKQHDKAYTLASKLIKDVEGVKRGSVTKQETSKTLQAIKDVAAKDGLGKGVADAIRKIISWATSVI